MKARKKSATSNKGVPFKGVKKFKFSIAGVSKKLSLGRKHGFEDEKQGNLFFALAEILEYHNPPAFVLENVKHLVNHDKGHTFKTIMGNLEKALGYKVYPKIIDAKGFVPQHRERIFAVPADAAYF